MNDNRPIVYEEDGKIYYRASALGGCLIALAAARQGYEVKTTPDNMQEIFDAGNTCEEEFVNLYPTLIENRQMEVELPITRRISVVGHIDGLRPGTGKIVEIKSQSDDEFRAWTPAHWTSNPLWLRYGWQTSVYMLALDREVDVVRVRRSNPEDFEIWTKERPDHSLDEIVERVLEVEALASENTLQCAGPFMYPCAYHYIHAECPVYDDEELLQAVSDYIVSSDNIKAMQEIKDKARVVLEQYLTSSEGGKLMTPNGVKLSRSEYDVKERIIPASHQVRITVTPPKAGK